MQLKEYNHIALYTHLFQCKTHVLLLSSSDRRGNRGRGVRAARQGQTLFSGRVTSKSHSQLSSRENKLR